MAPLAPATAILADNDVIAEPTQQTPTSIRDACESVVEPSLADREEQATFMARVIAAMNGLSNSGGSGGSVSGSGSSLGSHKPPKPPSCSQARKQLRLLPKQREQSPVLSNGNTTSTTTTSTTRHTIHKTSSNSSSTKQFSQSLSNGNCQQHEEQQQQENESHYEISLKLPLSTGSAAAPSPVPDAAAERLRLLTRSPSPAYSVSSRCSSTQSSRCSARTTSRCLETPPRRIFPQTYTRGSGLDAYEMRQLESSPVVFDANLSFVLGCKRQPVHQSVRPTPSFEDPRTSSAYLSEKIQNFLKRTDHVQEEWTAMGRRTRRHNTTSTTSLGNSRCSTPSGYDDYDTISLIERQRERNSMERCGSVGRTRSSQNILTKAFQLSKQLPHTPTSRGNSMVRESSVTHSVTGSISAMNAGDDDDDRTIREEDDNELDEVC